MKDKEKIELKNALDLPVVYVDGVVPFPENSCDFDVVGKESAAAVRYAEKHGNAVIIALLDNYFNFDDTEPSDEKLQPDGSDDLNKTEPDNSDIDKDGYEIINEILNGENDAEEENTASEEDENVTKAYLKVGVVGKITMRVKSRSRNSRERIFVECGERVTFEEYKTEEGASIAAALPFSYKTEDEDLIKACTEDLKDAFSELVKIEGLSDDLITNVRKMKDPVDIMSLVAHSGLIDYRQQQSILEIPELSNSIGKLIEYLIQAARIASMRIAVLNQAKANLESENRDTIIREQINILNAQLSGDQSSDPDQNDVSVFTDAANKLDLDPVYKEQLMKEISNYSQYPPMSQEASVIKNYLQTVFSIPWNDQTELNDNIEDAEKILRDDHYGLEKVKERITETISVQIMTGKTGSNILCLVGPPGTGKTSIAKSIAKATGRKFVRISLGGVRDEADIRGHRRTYLGSMPGRIIKALIEAKSNNALILLDEIDKMSSDGRGDPGSALLEVLDSEQNKNFKDHFIELPVDLSNVMFVATANDISGVQGPLIDRMEMIEITSYTREEKFHIAKEHLIPKQLSLHGLTKTKLKINDNSVYYLIDNYTKEAGVRGLERKIASICRKVDKIIVSGKAKSMTLSPKKIEELLGAKKYTDDVYMEKDTVGTVNGLAWTSVGGVLLPVEAVVMKGKGRVKLTGSLGEVMQESAEIAISYARMQSDKYGYDEDFIDKKDIHIHAPEGAVPKDGPSAGVTMTTALISALSGKKVRKDVAMTGEITLHGDVLPIGGLREKTMAAYKAGMQTVIVPFKNKPDMEEVDNTVKENLKFVFAKNLDDVLSTALK